MNQINKTYCIDQLAYPKEVFELPVKAIQFGTGVLLRGLVDFILQKANEQDSFNGRVAMVKSTSPDLTEFKDQDGIYTVVETGLNEQQEVHIKSTVIHCIGPLWHIYSDWEKIKNLFSDPKLELVVSNTTELGLIYHEEQILKDVPISFPGQLTALLYHRYLQLGDQAPSLTIVPTELLIDNGKLLLSLIASHAHFNNLPIKFIKWLESHVDFCDSLVDRIVPGKLKSNATTLNLPYKDSLAIQTEPYFLWAIQQNPNSKPILNLRKPLPGLIIAPDIQPYREQKLRLLNGGHTILSPLAYLLGCRTVEEMMKNEQVSHFLNQVCESEIIPTLTVLAPQASAFFQAMKNRWLNPFMEHQLKTILAQTTTKMQSRNGDTFIRYFETNQELPVFLSFGFAVYLYFFKPGIHRNQQYFAMDGQGQEFEINDHKAALLYQHWLPYFSGEKTIAEIIPILLNDDQIFNHAFVLLPEFQDKITSMVQSIHHNGLTPSLLILLNSVPQHV